MIYFIEWLAIWSIGWGGFKLLNQLGITYISSYPLGVVYFLIVFIILYYIKKRGFREYFSSWVPGLFLWGPICAGSVFLVYILVPLFSATPYLAFADHPKAEFIHFHFYYIITKSFEILFQQMMIFILVSKLKDFFKSNMKVVGLMMLLFGVAHSPLFFLDTILWGLFFTFSGITAGAVFSWILLYFTRGVPIAFFVHWLFYLISGCYFWITL